MIESQKSARGNLDVAILESFVGIAQTGNVAQIFAIIKQSEFLHELAAAVW